MRKLNFRVLFFCVVAFALGICVAREIFLPSILSLIFVICSVIALLVICLKFKCIKRFVIVFVAFIVGVGYYFAGYFVFVGTEYENKVVVRARVSSIYQSTGYKSIVLDDVLVEGESKNFCISLSLGGESDVKLGDILIFYGKLNNVNLFDEDGYNSFYYKNNTPYKCSVSADKVVIRDGYLKLDEIIRQSISNFLNENVNVDVANLISAVLFGDKNNLDSDIKEVYSLSGIGHLLAVSGLHIGFIVAMLSFVLDKLKLKKWINFLILFVILLFYAYICGFSPSVTRACLMSLVFAFSFVVGRKYDKLNCLGFVALLILLVKPLYVFDAGFLLSFASVFCIFTLSKPLTMLFRRAKLNTKLSQTFGLIVSVQFGLLPMMALYYETFNILSFFTNLICVPLFEITFMLTFVVVPLCMLLPFMHFFLSFIEFLFTLITLIASGVSLVSWANIDMTNLTGIFIVCFYCCCFILSRYYNIKQKDKFAICCFVLAMGLLFYNLSMLVI